MSTPTPEQPREADGRFSEKEGTAPEIALRSKRGIPKEIAEFESFVDLAVGRELSRGEEARLDILYYKLEALRVRHEGNQILSVFRTLDSSISRLHVVAGNGSDGYSADLYGVERTDAEGTTSVLPPTIDEVTVFDAHCRALKVPEAMEGVYERNGEQDDYLRDVWVVTDEED
jgi:hypothetical protein